MARTGMVARLGPVRQSGQGLRGNPHRPLVCRRRLRRVFYASPLVTVCYDPSSRKSYDRRRAAGKKRLQAELTLTRRCVNVLWALIRDRRCYEVAPTP